MPETLRQPIAISADSHRTLDLAFAVRFPRLAAIVLRGGWRLLEALSPRSRLRRRIVRTYARRGIDALNRGDLEPLFVFADPQIEAVNTPDLVAIGGFEAETRGREAFIEAEGRWEAQWERFRYQPNEVIDLGDGRVLLLGRVTAAGGASGVVVDSEWGLLATVSGGRLIREQNFLDRGQALKAAGLAAKFPDRG
jgi:ketosteroid isomerase-like protein